LPHQGGLAYVVAVREDDARDPALHEAREHVLRGLDGIDAQVSLGVADEIAVEVVAVGLGEPGPGEDAVHDLVHAVPPTRSYAGAPPRVNPTPRLYTRAFWIACTVHFTGGMSMGIFLLFPLFVRALGGDELTIGLVLGTGLAVSVGLRPTVGALLDRLGRRRVLLAAGVMNVASFPPFLLLGGTGPWLYLLATLHLVERGAVPVHAAAPRSAARDMARLVLRGGLLPVMAATVLFGAGINAAFYFVAPFTRDLHIARAAPFFAAYASTTIALRVFGRRL